MEKLNEKCAVVGIAGGDPENTPLLAIEALFAMQHRGAEASGVTTVNLDGGNLQHKRGLGLVTSVYDDEDVKHLRNNIAIGHNRYSTNGDKEKHLLPCVETPIGFSFSLNGNIPDMTKMDEYLMKNKYQIGQFNDAEKMSLIISSKIHSGMDIVEAVADSYDLFTGSFSCTATHDGRVVSFRDPCGIRPLEVGEIDEGIISVSETCALDITDANFLFTVNPGEIVEFDNKSINRHQVVRSNPKLDIFEFVYFARHDSNIEGQSVHRVRQRFGRELAEQHPLDFGKDTLVAPVPDTSIPAAEAYAEHLNLNVKQAIIKNRYIGRTFMQPTQGERKKQLRRKHTMIPELVKGKDLILIDDSIVRLNTMPRIVRLAKDLGAKSVSVLIASSPVRFPDFYGIDTPKQENLAAAVMTIEEMRRDIDCKYLGFLSLNRMVRATNIDKNRLNLSCFTGEYPIDIGANNKRTIFMPKDMSCIE